MSVIELERTEAPAELDEDAQALLGAAQIIRERGKCVGKFGIIGETRCALGAIAEAMGLEHGASAVHSEPSYRLAKSIGIVYPMPSGSVKWTSITGWSDAHTADEVADAMERAAWL